MCTDKEFIDGILDKIDGIAASPDDIMAKIRDNSVPGRSSNRVVINDGTNTHKPPRKLSGASYAVIIFDDLGINNEDAEFDCL